MQCGGTTITPNHSIRKAPQVLNARFHRSTLVGLTAVSSLGLSMHVASPTSLEQWELRRMLAVRPTSLPSRESTIAFSQFHLLASGADLW